MQLKEKKYKNRVYVLNNSWYLRKDPFKGEIAFLCEPYLSFQAEAVQLDGSGTPENNKSYSNAEGSAYKLE